MQLETERLILREFRVEDWSALYAIERDPVQVRYQSFEAHTEASARAYVDAVIADALALPRLVYDFALTLRGSDELRGRAGMKRDEHSAEIWFNVAPDLKGQGYATEALRAVLAFGFGSLGLHRIYGDCDPRNPASARVMERAGMRREGHLVQNVFLKGEWCDSIIYALLASEWTG